MTPHVNRRHFLKTVMAAGGAVALPDKAISNRDSEMLRDDQKYNRLKDDAISHGGLQQVNHHRLKTEITGQTAIRYLRFGRIVRLHHLELERMVYGRWVPKVPTHPAHITIATLKRPENDWQIIQEVELPYDPAINGEGLNQDMSTDEMDKHFERILQQPPFVIPLNNLETDHLRVICDREHPVWPNHGECNGGIYNVPFGILHKVAAYGEPVSDYAVNVDYRPILQQCAIQPQAPPGMEIINLPNMILYRGKYLSIGFSLIRPMLMHLGWDITGKGGSAEDRLLVTRQPRMDKKTGGVSGPSLRTLYNDYPPHLWTGKISVAGNQVIYQDLETIEGLKLTAVFTIYQDQFTLELEQTCSRSIPVIEADAWRFACDIRKGITALAGMPTQRPGRNGDVSLPAMWATDGNGSLLMDLQRGKETDVRLQVESYRDDNALAGSLVFGSHPGEDHCQLVPEGRKEAVLKFALDNFLPHSQKDSVVPGEGLQRHWGTVFACFRPEYRGFSNHSISTNCHLSQGPPIEIVTNTKPVSKGLNPMDLARFTIGKALLDGGGYGYWRSLYLDSDPVLLSAAGRIHQMDADMNWLRKVAPGLVEIAERMLGLIAENGMMVCHDLSGNSGSYRWSSNSMDVVGFGHIDGYVNAWAYRGFRNAAAMLEDLGQYPVLAVKCRQAASNLRNNYALHLLNPETKWVAGWRSRDNQLHDYGFIWVNGVALAFGLVDRDIAIQALAALEQKRAESGPPDARMGLPCNLIPIREEDQMLAKIFENRNPTFETYTDGSLSGWPATYYLRALSIYGFKEGVKKIITELNEGYMAGIFNGGNRSGHEFRSWEGLPTGYEGTLIGCFGPMYAVAVEEGVIEPADPEWWPGNG